MDAIDVTVSDFAATLIAFDRTYMSRQLVVRSPVGWILTRTPQFTFLAARTRKIWTSH